MKESFLEERHFEVKYLFEASKGGFHAVKVVTVPRFPPANINKHQKVSSGDPKQKGKISFNRYFLKSLANNLFQHIAVLMKYKKKIWGE